ncbi:MAG: hypothetical protein AB8G05_24290 [Oligoflexales bacterium]
MKFIVPFFCMIIFCLSACKTSLQRKALPSRDFIADREQIEEDPLTNTMDDLQKSIDVYKESEEYTDPKTESEEDFNEMVDAVDQVEKEEAEFLAEKGEFEKAEERAEEVEQLTNIYGPESDDDSRSIRKSGILMISLGALGTLGTLAAGYGLEVGYRRLKNPSKASALSADGQKQVDDVIEVGKQLGNPELDKLVNKFRITNLAIAGIPVAFLLMGSLLVSQEQPSEAMVNASQVLLYSAGGLGTAAGVSLAAVAANPSWSRRAVDVISQKSTDIAVKITPGAMPGKKLPKTNSPGTISVKNTLNDEVLTQMRKFTLGSGLILAALGGTVLFSGSKLNLTASEESPKVRLLRSIDLFFHRLQKIESGMKHSKR